GQRVTAVWGPPGTGKTHFLASAVVSLAAAHARAGRPFRVLVSAFTHAAIENLLRKVAELASGGGQPPRGALRGLPPPARRGTDLSLAIGKAKYWQSAIEAAEVLDEADLASWLDAHDHAVLGATAYSMLKQEPAAKGFDLVVIDEASQVRVP